MPQTHIGNGPNAARLIVSLCDYSGRWLHAYKANGYTTIQFDLKHGDDCTQVTRTVTEVYQFRAEVAAQLGLPVSEVKVQGVLMAPVCTDFSVSGAQYWARKDADGTTARSLALVDACVSIALVLAPDWWALENPVGRLKALRPELPFIGWFQPHQYAHMAPDVDADRYTKKTGLWGTARMPVGRPLDDPRNLPIRVCKQGSWLQKLGGKSERTKELRSMTPLGFATCFFLANT